MLKVLHFFYWMESDLNTTEVKLRLELVIYWVTSVSSFTDGVIAEMKDNSFLVKDRVLYWEWN